MPVLGALRGRLAKARGRTGFVRSVGVLVGGTAFAQAITMLALPVLTRLYTPADFVALAVFTSLTGLISVSACLRLEIAIPLPEKDEDAANVMAVALLSCSVIGALTAAVVWCFPGELVELVAQPSIKSYLWLIPIGVWFPSAYSAAQFWGARKKRFEVIASTKITQAVGGGATQIGLGWAGTGPLGLLLGQLVMSGAGLWRLGRNFLREDKAALSAISWPRMRSLLRQYDRFPKYSTLEAFANSAAVQVPLIAIAAVASGPEAGYLLLAMNALTAPLVLIGRAVSQVYLSQAADEARAGRLAAFTIDVIAGLVRTGVGPIVFAGIVAPTFFPLIFGERWLRAGELVAWMTPWFAMQFLTSPISMTLHVTGSQRAALGLQLFGLALRVGAVALAAILATSYVSEAYAISGFFFYSAYFAVVVAASEIPIINLVRTLMPGLPIVLCWAGLGVTSMLLCSRLF